MWHVLSPERNARPLKPLATSQHRCTTHLTQSLAASPRPPTPPPQTSPPNQRAAKADAMPKPPPHHNPGPLLRPPLAPAIRKAASPSSHPHTPAVRSARTCASAATARLSCTRGVAHAAAWQHTPTPCWRDP
eukprot:7378689-Prymnesium_polylepis.1